MGIVVTPEKDFSRGEMKAVTRKVRTSDVNSSSISFSCSVYAIYNRVYFSRKKLLMLKSYIPGID